jgi:bis(5'-nucleosyl)-tetraphosphatase (symmetrical)
MSHYVVGDIQGCHAEFSQLLDLIAFDPASDRLWLVGDLVNRGPESLAVLRTVKALGNAAVTVLGNHDFHLLTVAEGHRQLHGHDTLAPILDAPDREELLAWLRTRSLVVGEGDLLMVHAGLLPSWTASAALAYSREVEAVLASDDHTGFLRDLYGDEPSRWSDSLSGYDRLRGIVNVCTRLRFCSADDVLELSEKRGPEHTPPGYSPWYAHPHRKSAAVTVFCGHWSALGLLLEPRVAMLDSGCLWGGTLTALRLDDWRVFQIPSRAPLHQVPRE